MHEYDEDIPYHLQPWVIVKKYKILIVHYIIAGLQADPSVKIRVEPGLFEFKLWHMAKGLTPFMTPQELQKAGYNVDVE